jgi:MFS family permease
MGHFLNDGMFFLVPVIVDLIATARDIDATLITISLVLYYVSTAISANLFGRIIDKRHLQSLGMILGIAVMSTGMLLFSIALNHYMVSYFLIISSIITGIGASFYHPTGTAILQSYYKGNKLGRYLGINGSAGSLGRAIFPSLLLAVGIVLVSSSSSAVFFGILGLAVSSVMFLFIREYMDKEKLERPPKKTQIAKPLSDENSPASSKSAVGRGIILLAIISLIRNISFFSVVAWIPEYLSFVRGYGASLSLGMTMTLMFSGGIIGQLIIGLLVENHDKRKILITTTVLSVVLMILYLFSNGTESLMALAAFGFFNFSGFPIFMSMIADYVPRGSTTVSNAIVWNLGGTTGQAVGPLIIGVIIAGTYSRLPYAFEIMLALGLFTALIVLALPKPAKEVKAPLFA